MSNPYIKEEKELELEDISEEDDEELKVLNWRGEFFQQILGNSVDDEDIELLVLSEASPHDAIKLIRADCSPELVVAILA